MNWKPIQIIIFCLITILITGCARLKVPNDFNSILNDQNLEEIEGTYKHLSKGFNRPFWQRFCSPDINKYERDSSSTIKIKLEPDQTIRFELYIKNKLQTTETFRYSFQDKGLAIKGKSNFRYQGVPFIFYSYESQALWLSKDNEEELFLSFKGSSSGGIFILIFGTPILGESRFEKIMN